MKTLQLQYDFGQESWWGSQIFAHVFTYRMYYYIYDDDDYNYFYYYTTLCLQTVLFLHFLESLQYNNT